uniref:Cell death activator CIDE-A-like n=1 Tax=Sinocyclocheilus anshuiensis TaxID=1608454 RepID=A0A671LYL2_9TELE
MWCCRSVSSVQTSLAHPQTRPYKVCTQNRRRRKGFTASSLADLMEQVRSLDVFLTLVLEDDGTVVDSEAFFQSLPTNTAFMVLEKGQPRRSGIAKLSFDLYKLNPKDFLGCLTVKATLYEIYTLSYDIKCTRQSGITMVWKVFLVVHVLKGLSFPSLFSFFRSLLWCFMYMAKLVGQVLLYGSAYVLRYIGDEESSS